MKTRLTIPVSITAVATILKTQMDSQYALSKDVTYRSYGTLLKV